MEAPVLAAAVTGADTVALHWNAVAGAVRYELWAWESASDWQQLDDGSLTGTSFTHSELTPDTTYYYTIRALDAAGATSAWSEHTPATVPGTQPAAPTPTKTAAQSPTQPPTQTPTPSPAVPAPAAPVLSAEAGDSAIDLRWPQVAGAARYEL